jgi:hypothetical protein
MLMTLALSKEEFALDGRVPCEMDLPRSRNMAVISALSANAGELSELTTVTVTAMFFIVMAISTSVPVAGYFVSPSC